MVRPDTNHEERKSQIVQVATRVFARYGFEGTTNRLIAEEMRQQLGVNFSPALIYHYFENKQALFTVVMHQFPAPQVIGGVIRENLDQPPEIFFRRLGLAFLEAFEDEAKASMMRMVLSEGPHHPELVQIVFAEIKPAVLLPLIGYINRQIMAGQLRQTNPLSLFMQFTGPLVQRVLMLSLGILRSLPLPLPGREEFVDELVTGFLHGNAKG